MIPVLILALLSPAVACQEGTVYDDLDTPFALTTLPPRRIVSLAPNITEILFSLGLGDRIVGVTRFCNFPPEALRKERIGGMVDLSLERIEFLQPDLVVAFRGNPLGALYKLRQLGVPVFILDLGDSIDGLFRAIEKVGRVTRTEKPAEGLVEGLKKRGREVSLRLQNVPERPKVFLSVYGQGLWTCGRESYLNDLLNRAGGVNIAGNIPRRWLQLNREQLIHENPDVIIIMAKEEEAFARARQDFHADPRLRDIAAIDRDEIYLLDEDLAGRFGPRLIDALEEVARILHPESFKAGQ